jgi:DNA mismatch repair protein MutS2
MNNRETLRILEFDKILKTVAGFANSGISEERVLDIVPLTARVEIENRFGQVEEIRGLSRKGVPLRLSRFEDIMPVLDNVRPEGAVLDPRDLVLFIPVLRIIASVSTQMKYRTDIPLLGELTARLTGFPDILEPLEQSLDSEGNILDTASSLLFDLRTRKRNLTARIRKRLEEIVRDGKISVFLQDDFITQRGGRWVIPVRMDSKGQVAGVVHDVSNSGETAFMEPLEIIGLANELENLTAEEKVEEIRILREICGWIREDSEEIESQFDSLVCLDLLNCIARFAEIMEAQVPIVEESGGIRLVQARHPILMLLQKEGSVRDVVPLDVSLGDSDTVMVITGPNAGGKTIAIKTVGLLHLMVLSGIPVPVGGTSSFPLISELLVDLGDEQSIESSMSTFSAHVSNIAGILRRADSRTLVLIDEMGTGTEPVQGAAIACSVLRELQQKGALVFATTHLTEIAGFVHKTRGMVNAAMEFDQQTLSPLYRLKAGEPGQSHALDIARRYGLPDTVIEFAKGMLGRMDTEFHSLIAELKEKRQRHEEILESLARREKELDEKARIMGERQAAAELQKRESLEKAYLEAREIVSAARRETRAILDEAKREKSRTALKQLEEAEIQVEEKLREFHPETTVPIDDIREGDTVFVRSIGYDASVLKIDKSRNRLRVKAGVMEIEVQVSDVSPKKGKAAQPSKKGARRPAPAEEAVPAELKLLGMRVEAALTRLEKFLNHASLEGLKEVRIIHGIGTGALLAAVREHVDGHPLVSDYRPGEQYEGGNGATIVTLR